MISVVVPLYNEEDNVAQLQRELAAALAGQDHELIFVDDGSQDGTVERIDRRPEVRLLEFEKNSGQSAAMYAGIQAAQGDVIVLLDGDLQILFEAVSPAMGCATLVAPSKRCVADVAKRSSLFMGCIASSRLSSKGWVTNLLRFP